MIVEQKVEPILIKKASQCVFVRFGDLQLLNVLNFIIWATSFGSLLKTYKTLDTKRYFPLKCFDDPVKFNKIFIRSHEKFLSKLFLFNRSEKDHSRCHSFIVCGMTSKDAKLNLKICQSPGIGQEDYQYLISVWQNERFCTFKKLSSITTKAWLIF